LIECRGPDGFFPFVFTIFFWFSCLLVRRRGGTGAGEDEAFFLISSLIIPSHCSYSLQKDQKLPVHDISCPSSFPFPLSFVTWSCYPLFCVSYELFLRMTSISWGVGLEFVTPRNFKGRYDRIELPRQGPKISVPYI